GLGLGSLTGGWQMIKLVTGGRAEDIEMEALSRVTDRLASIPLLVASLDQSNTLLPDIRRALTRLLPLLKASDIPHLSHGSISGLNSILSGAGAAARTNLFRAALQAAIRGGDSSTAMKSDMLLHRPSSGIDVELRKEI